MKYLVYIKEQEGYERPFVVMNYELGDFVRTLLTTFGKVAVEMMEPENDDD